MDRPRVNPLPMDPARPGFVQNTLAAFVRKALVLLLTARAIGDPKVGQKARDALGAALAGGMGLANLAERTRVLLAHYKPTPKQEVVYTPPALNKVVWAEPVAIPGARVPPVFREALADLEKRIPAVVKPAWLNSAQAVGELYATTGEGVIAAVHAADERVSERIQKWLAEKVRSGMTTAQVEKALRDDIQSLTGDLSNWTNGYTEMVIRTNLTGAQANGRIEQASDPDLKDTIAALLFQATMDDATRPNHAACHGALAPPEHPLIRAIKPPLGYNCRCDLVLVTWARARRMGIVDGAGKVRVVWPKQGGGPDRGFTHAGSGARR